MTVIVERLRQVILEAPRDGEHEPNYTARCLLPPVRVALDELRIPGLLAAGDGGTPVQPVPLFGLLFYPDLTVRYHGAAILAIEVKYLGRQNSVATALGQAYLYRRAGYRHTGAFLVDRANQIKDDQIKEAEEVCGSADIDIIVRRASKGFLVEHPV